MKPDCNQFSGSMRWMAQDSDGSWWAYEHEPNMADSGWYENEVGGSERLSKESVNPQWRETLQRINE